MRLLNTSTLVLHTFYEPYPDYVVLSHMWKEGEEVSFDDIDQPHAQRMQGYWKIKGCCDLAVKDGFDWAWIDTCCIDKKSSSELSEAINSMYDWYWSASKCYAYLADVQSHRDVIATQESFETSRWFRRGWSSSTLLATLECILDRVQDVLTTSRCLQELLAPDVVEFYDEAWKFVGTKAQLIAWVQRATNIDRIYLADRDAIKSASIATKLSWAADRHTTRPEDMAYCLLGLVEVNMPMLYGENEHAFYRLQLELIRQYNEHTIFAWESVGQDWESKALFAQSPACFRQSAQIVAIEATDASSFEITNNGLRITLPCLEISQDKIVAILNCKNASGSQIGLWLEKTGDRKYQRFPSSKLVTLPEDDVTEAELRDIYLAVSYTQRKERQKKETSLLVGRILGDKTCMVDGIATSTPSRGFQVIEPPRFQLPTFGMQAPTNQADRLSDQSDYLFHNLILGDQEVLCFRLHYGDLEPRAYYQRSLRTFLLFIGLHKGKAVVGFEKQYLWDQTSLQERCILRANDHTVLAGDSVTKRIPLTDQPITVAIESRKQRRHGKMRWTLAIRVFECSCDGPSDADSCACRWQDKMLQSLECVQYRSSLIDNSQLWDEHFAARNINLKFEDCCCELCTFTAIIDPKSGLHFLECSCWACRRESKIEAVFNPSDDLHEPRRILTWAQGLLRLAPRRKRSAEF